MQVLELSASQIELLNFMEKKLRQQQTDMLAYPMFREHLLSSKRWFKRLRFNEDLTTLIHLGIIEEKEERRLHLQYRISDAYRHYLPFHYQCSKG